MEHNSFCSRGFRLWTRLRLCHRQPNAPNEALGLMLRRLHSDSAFRYFGRQVDVVALCSAIRDWTIPQIPASKTDLRADLRRQAPGVVIEPTADGGSVYGLRPTASKLPGCTCHAVFSRPGHVCVLLPRSLAVASRLVPPLAKTSSGLCSGSCFASWISSAFRRITYILRVSFGATDHEVSHARDIAWTLWANQATEHNCEAWIVTRWIVVMSANGARNCKPF